MAARAFGPNASRRVMIEMLQGRRPPADDYAIGQLFEVVSRGEARFLDVTDDDGSKHYLFLGYSID